MKRQDTVLLRHVIDELANSLQAAIGLATRVQQSSRASVTDASQLEASIARAVTALRRLEPRSHSRRRQS
jgi:hypothetical protein